MIEEKVLENGYLDDDYKSMIEKITKENKSLFEILYKYNKFLYKIQSEFNNYPMNLETNYHFATFIQIHKLYQSCVIMIKYGLLESYESILRIILESSINMLYSLISKKNILILEKYSINQNLKRLNYIEKKKIFDVISKDKVYKYRRILEKEKEQITNEIGNIEKPNNEVLFKRLNHKKEYLYYRYLCDYAHMNKNITDSIVKETDGKFIFDGEPDYSDIKNSTIRLIGTTNLFIEEFLKKYFPDLIKEYELLKKQ